MSGYSETPLQQKLGLKDGSTVRFINLPEDYFNFFEDLPSDLVIVENDRDAVDFVHLFITKKYELRRWLPKLKEQIKSDGLIWVSWPKQKSGIRTDMTEQAIRDVALPLGLVDNKVAAVSEEWSGLKLVIRKALRE